ncbi:hypothetical protein V6N13_106857 [Hibiscus sabdariffa]
MPTSHNQTVNQKSGPAYANNIRAGPSLCPANCLDQPSPIASPPVTPPGSPHPIPAATSEDQDSHTATPESIPEAADHQSPPAQAIDASPVHIFQLRNQLQRMEARELQFMEDTKVLQNSLVNFLTFQFPNDVVFFSIHPDAPSPSIDASTVEPSAEAGQTEPLHFPSNVANDAFDWNTPLGHPPSPPAQMQEPPSTTDIPKSSNMRKRKALAGRVLTEDPQLSPAATTVPEEQTSPTRPKRQRRYHIIISDNDVESSSPPDRPSSQSQAF